ncbi:hypothetical protein P4646_09510 [Peribacillus simplex]|uniref:hypothetical protein n=1 Tax=Peribacillus simplex TaxID=1478 RepID=UPI002E23EFAC|nr:hypothetical protein [Peribacillus simplex]MED4097076.1 hypothetical protein [Peribacillus simplex]
MIISDVENKHEIIPYEVGDSVRVQQTCTEEEDSESFYYIQAFDKKKGEVLKVINHPRLQYRVRFGQAEAVLYHEEIML